METRKIKTETLTVLFLKRSKRWHCYNSRLQESYLATNGEIIDLILDNTRMSSAGTRYILDLFRNGEITSVTFDLAEDTGI